MNPRPLGEPGPSLTLGNSCHPVVSNTHSSHLGPDVLEVRAWPEEGKKGISTLVSAGDTQGDGVPLESTAIAP